MEGSEVFIVPL